MQYRHRLETTFKSTTCLGRQADFWYQNDRAPAKPDKVFDGPNIDFGLSAASDTMQNECLAFATINRRSDSLQGMGLVLGQSL